MADFTVTKTRFVGGVWEGVIRDAGEDVPAIEVSNLGNLLADVSVIRDETASGHWNLRIPIPVDVLCDGVLVFLITNKNTGEKLDAFTIIAGEPLEDDIRADVELLRAELDMIKRAFRRHCLESH